MKSTLIKCTFLFLIIVVLVLYFLNFSHMIDGFSISKQQIYPNFLNNTKLVSPLVSTIGFLFESEHWIFVHFFYPFLISIFIRVIYENRFKSCGTRELVNSIIPMLIIYLWEGFEVFISTVVSILISLNVSIFRHISSWLHETSGGSLLGDILIGIAGIVYAKIIMSVLIIKNGSIRVVNSRSKYGDNAITFRMITFIILTCWMELLAGFTLIVNDKYVNVFGLKYVPIGYMIYPMLRLISFEILWLFFNFNYSDIMLIEKCENFKKIITITFMWCYLSTVFLSTWTYLSMLFGILTSLLALSIFL